jgi:hypothetical protein
MKIATFEESDGNHLAMLLEDYGSTDRADLCMLLAAHLFNQITSFLVTSSKHQQNVGQVVSIISVLRCRLAIDSEPAPPNGWGKGHGQELWQLLAGG